MAQEKRTSQGNQTVDTEETRPGGYHDRGVPGEEAEVRKIMRVLKIKDLQRTVRQSQPIKGGLNAEDTSRGRYEAALASGADRPASYRVVYVLARTDADWLETPVLETRENGQKEVVPVFTKRETAIAYLQTTRWPDYELEELSPQGLEAFCQEAQRQNIHLLTVNPGIPDRPEQQPSNVILLDQQPDLSGENLFHEIWSLAEGGSVSSRKP